MRLCAVFQLRRKNKEKYIRWHLLDRWLLTSLILLLCQRKKKQIKSAKKNDTHGHMFMQYRGRYADVHLVVFVGCRLDMRRVRGEPANGRRHTNGLRVFCNT